MKTTTLITKKLVLTCAVLALAASLPLTARAADQVKGGQHLLHLQQIKTQKDVDDLKTGDTFAMVCAKCKTVWVTQIKREAKGAQLIMEGGQVKELIGTHACAGCNSTMEVVGHGKGKEAIYKHTCKACGDDSGFCCATKPGGGPTKGMEKK